MVNFGLLAAEIGPAVWGIPANFNGFRVTLASVTARHCSSGRQPNFAALNKDRFLAALLSRPAYIRQGRAAITLGIGRHF